MGWTMRKCKDWKCKYCGTILHTRVELFKHFNDCTEKKKLPIDSLGRTYTLESRIKTAQTTKQRIKDGTIVIKPVSEEIRKKMSIRRKEYLKTHPSSHHWCCPHMHRSYAEQYFYDIIAKECGTQVNWKNNLFVEKYWLDFANLDNKVYFEVDGEQHYTPEGILKDNIRTSELASKGWFLISRIRWRSFLQMDEQRKKIYISELVNAFMSKETNQLPSLPEMPANEKQKQHFLVQRIINRGKRKKAKRARQIADSEKKEIARRNGLIRKDGRINGRGVTYDEWERRKNLIFGCGVDLMRFGWNEMVIQKTGLTKRIISNTINHFPNEFCGKYYKRKPVCVKEV